MLFNREVLPSRKKQENRIVMEGERSFEACFQKTPLKTGLALFYSFFVLHFKKTFYQGKMGERSPYPLLTSNHTK
ncbi:hypothetical protein EFB08_22805 [Rufibacter latericius]|uniref:Uncharacterized protein n=1 Tax=Rufibacter latericius TaxID=2487040 RepID=A0A3M9MBK6_9BACT|nr:hypothetical protein EFB08_22805 [Rufibacter latericius]